MSTTVKEVYHRESYEHVGSMLRPCGACGMAAVGLAAMKTCILAVVVNR